MLKVLVEQARKLPEEVEKLALEAQQAKQVLHELLELQKQEEARIALEVASEKGEDGKARFPNEAARQGEIARRILASERWRELKRDIDEARREWWEAEAKLERLKLEHRTTVALLDLVAGAIRAGKSPEEAEALLAGQGEENASRAPAKAPTKGSQEKDSTNGTQWATVRVLEAKPGKSEGTLRITAEEVGSGEERVIFAKNSVAEKLARSVGKRVKVEYRELDHGWFAVAVKAA